MQSTAISYLFVPGSRPDRLGKALATDADAVIVDLEDAVSPSSKGVARTHVLAALEAGLPRPVHVRVNAPDSEWFEDDIAALRNVASSGRRSLAGVVVSKTQFAADIDLVRAVADSDGFEIVALIENAVGISHRGEIAAAPGLSRFAVGTADLSLDLDVGQDSATIDWVYSQLVVESRLAGLPGPIASPPFEIRDISNVEGDAARLRSLGATAQLCIHPDQIAPIHAGFLPTADLVEWARRVIAAEPDSALQADG